jgi:hypothetical protein
VDIKILPRKIIGGDLTQIIDIIFPGPIDPGSFNMNAADDQYRTRDGRSSYRQSAATL